MGKRNKRKKVQKRGGKRGFEGEPDGFDESTGQEQEGVSINESIGNYTHALLGVKNAVEMGFKDNYDIKGKFESAVQKIELVDFREEVASDIEQLVINLNELEAKLYSGDFEAAWDELVGIGKMGVVKSFELDNFDEIKKESAETSKENLRKSWGGCAKSIREVMDKLESKYGNRFNFLGGLNVIGSDELVEYLESDNIDWSQEKVLDYQAKLGKFEDFLKILFFACDEVDGEDTIADEIVGGRLSGDLEKFLYFADDESEKSYEKFLKKNKDESDELSVKDVAQIEKELNLNENGVWRSSIKNVASYEVVGFDSSEMKVSAKKEGGENIFSWPLGDWRKMIDNSDYSFVKAGEPVEDIEEAEGEDGKEKTEEEQKQEAKDKAQELIDFIDANAQYIDRIGHEKTRNWFQKIVKNNAQNLIRFASKKSLKQLSEWYGQDKKGKFNTPEIIIKKIEDNIKEFKRLDFYLNEFSTNVLDKLEELKTKHADEEDVVSAIQAHIEKIESSTEEIEKEFDGWDRKKTRRTFR